MDEENRLLEIPLPSKTKSPQCNPRGRPKLEKIIKFSPQPKSIVSQMLRNIKTDSNKNSKCQRTHSKGRNKYIDENTRSEIGFLRYTEGSDIELQNDCIESDQEKDELTISNENLQLYKTNEEKYELEISNINKNDCLTKSNPNKTKKESMYKNHLSHTKETEVICEICSHRSNNLKEHRKHAVTHIQYACDYPECTYISKVSSNLIKHKRVHTAEKPYLCDQCTFRTNFVNSLKTHKRIHSAERPYCCKYCDYRCNSSSNLKKHCLHRHNGLSNSK